MRRLLTWLLGVSVLVSTVLLASCSKETQTQQAATQTQSSAPPAAQVPQATQPAPAPAASPPPAASPSDSVEKASGNKATEKHKLSLANNSRVAVTVTVNGVWVGQWDADASAPLDAVVQGKNELVVDLQDEPKSWVTLEVNAERGGQNVNLLRLNFQGKKAGKYTYNFVAR